MKEFINKNIKVISIVVVVILLGLSGLTFAITMNDINVNIGSGNYNVVYSGTATLPSSTLQPVVDSELLNSDNASKIIKVNFTVKGAQNNPTGKDVIYDVSLTNLSLTEGLHSRLLKWRLYKNNSLLSEGSFAKEFDIQVNNRMVLTNTQQDLPSYSSTADSYTFYIWISEECTGDITTCTEDMDVTSLLNKTLSGEIRIELSTGSKKVLERPATANTKIINLATSDACNAGGTGVCATNSYTASDGTTAYHDYRYRGAEPNNYVRFNNDLYRIIGVFDDNSHGVEGQYLIKLIRSRILGDYSWGAYNTTNTSGTYSSYNNDWTGNTTGVKANANVLLNEYFYNKTNTSSTYGSCSNWTYYFSANNYKTFSCSDIVGHGIDSSLQNYIENVTWYLKGYKDYNYSKQNFYLCERGLSTDTTNCMSGNSGAYNASTTGKIGLMYASDYLYASSYFADTSTTSGSSQYYGNKNWLYKGLEWTITPDADSATDVFSVSITGFVNTYNGVIGCGVRPTFYLKSTIGITGGSGTIEDPYILSA